MHKVIYGIFLIVLGLFSCTGSRTNEKNGIIKTDLSVDEFEIKTTEAGVQLIDVRTPEEFNSGHLEGAINADISSGVFEERSKELDKNKPVLVYCLSGGRSSAAAGYLEDNGFTQIYNLTGGMMAWNASGKKVASGKGRSGKGISTEEFEKLIDNDKYVLIDFNAKWCLPCKRMAPILEKLSKENTDKMILIKIDADENKELLKAKGISSVPVLQLYKDKSLIWTQSGEMSEKEIIEKIKFVD